MTAVIITTTTAVPTVNGDADTWGTKLNAKWATAKADLDALALTPANSIKGNNTGSPQGVDDLTGTQVTAMLTPVVGDSGSGGTKGLAPAPTAGDAAAQKYLKADGTYAAPVAAQGGWTAATAAAIGTPRGISMVRNGAGDYTFTLSPAMANANYFVSIAARGLGYNANVTSATKNTTTFSVGIVGSADPDEIWIQVYP